MAKDAAQGFLCLWFGGSIGWRIYGGVCLRPNISKAKKQNDARRKLLLNDSLKDQDILDKIYWLTDTPSSADFIDKFL